MGSVDSDAFQHIRLGDCVSWRTMATNTILQLLLLLTWDCITSATVKNPLYGIFFTSFVVLAELVSAVSLTFADGLFETLRSANPPTIAWLKSLPTELEKKWAVYLLVLEKAGSRPRVYIGSSTCKDRGVRARFKQYEDELWLPINIEVSLHDGFTITSRGLLAWTPIPSPAFQPVIRLFFLALEATLAHALWSMSSTYSNDALLRLCP